MSKHMELRLLWKLLATNPGMKELWQEVTGLTLRSPDKPRGRGRSRASSLSMTWRSWQIASGVKDDGDELSWAKNLTTTTTKQNTKGWTLQSCAETSLCCTNSSFSEKWTHITTVTMLQFYSSTSCLMTSIWGFDSSTIDSYYKSSKIQGQCIRWR